MATSRKDTCGPLPSHASVAANDPKAVRGLGAPIPPVPPAGVGNRLGLHVREQAAKLSAKVQGQRRRVLYLGLSRFLRARGAFVILVHEISGPPAAQLKLRLSTALVGNGCSVYTAAAPQSRENNVE